LLLQQKDEVWEPSNKQWSFGIQEALDREVMSLFSVVIGMLRPIVGVAVGSAGTLRAVCNVTEQDDKHWVVILTIKESRNRIMGHVARTGRAEMRTGFWWGCVKDKDKDIAWSGEYY